VSKKLLVAAALSFWLPRYVELLGSLDDPIFRAPDDVSAELLFGVMVSAHSTKNIVAAEKFQCF
jgi:peptidoglycan/LPS O-acetylase OafA/YrhL